MPTAGAFVTTWIKCAPAMRRLRHAGGGAAVDVSRLSTGRAGRRQDCARPARRTRTADLVSAAELPPNPTGGTIVAMVAEYAKVSVTLPAGLLERIRGRVGARGLSSYVAEALEDEERRSALRAWLAQQDDEYGPVPASLLEEVRNEWLGAGG